VQQHTSCARCGAGLSPDSSVSGLCPACLLQLGLAPESTASTVAPALAGATHASQRPASHLRFAPRASVPAVGGPFGPYRLMRELGRGGFGSVWEAEHRETGRRLALKVVTEVRAGSPRALERFEREGRLAASVNHPNCVFVFGAEEIDGYPAITMELMAGGTLQDEIIRRGRIPPKQAVDYMLNVIDGLDAAHDAGVIHRDVKPSNCFLDEHGAVKIGDFGISKTLEGDVQLTLSGSFVGTPVYASPEQARGREVDFRSDMFSVGATLYTLVTGKPPFSGSSAADVLARVLTEDPPAAAQQGVELPKGFERVLRRAMAKDPNKRYRDYPSLRAALLPFSSRGLTPAGLAQRLCAYLIDMAIVFQPTAVLMVPLGLWIMDSRSALMMILFSQFGPYLYYFGFTEGMWGKSLGKRLVGLRVTTAAGSPVSARRAWIRIFLFQAVLTLGGVAQFVAMNLGSSPMLSPLFGFLGTFLMLVTMRGRNGYAGLHELLSGTRVVAVAPRERTSVPSAENARIGEVGNQQRARFGPYRYLADVWETGDEALALASDEVLKRQVWIHRLKNPTRAMPVSEQASTRPGRLRWLTGSRRADDCRDAYESPSGIGLREWVTLRKRLSWKDARGVLLGLAAELEHTPAARRLSVDHVWVNAYGQVNLLDFPAAATSAPVLIDGAEPFLQHVALFALEGRLVPADQLDGKMPGVPLPEHARPILEEIADAGQGDSRISSVLMHLQSIAAHPAAVTRARRLGPLLAVAGPVLMGPFSVAMASFMPMMMERSGEPFFELMRYSQELRRQAVVARRGEPVSREEVEAVGKLVAASYARARNTPLFLQVSPSDEDRRMWEAWLKAYPNVTDAEIEDARTLMRTLHPSGLPAFPSSTPEDQYARTQFTTIFLTLLWPSLVALPAIVFAVLLRGGLIFRLSGIALQTSDGRRAGRVRCLCRALLVWSPFLVLFPVFPGLGLNPIAGAVPLPVLVPAAVAGFVYALVRPERGVPDLIVGTYLVPK
jgi:hypothetical protein